MSMTIKSLREEEHLSQEELATVLHLPLSTVQELEIDSSSISDLVLDKYLLHFHIGYDELYLGTQSNF